MPAGPSTPGSPIRALHFGIDSGSPWTGGLHSAAPVAQLWRTRERSAAVSHATAARTLKRSAAAVVSEADGPEQLSQSYEEQMLNAALERNELLQQAFDVITSLSVSLGWTNHGTQQGFGCAGPIAARWGCMSCDYVSMPMLSRQACVESWAATEVKQQARLSERHQQACRGHG